MNMPALKKILVVDDEQSILLSLSHVLKAEGVEVITCNEIEQAETALDSTYFDLVIADIRMSGVNGIEGLELLSYVKDHFDTKVIIMSGYGDNDTKNEAYQRGALYYFQKPVDIPELLKQVSFAGIPVNNSWLRDSQNTTM